MRKYDSWSKVRKDLLHVVMMKRRCGKVQGKGKGEILVSERSAMTVRWGPDPIGLEEDNPTSQTVFFRVPSLDSRAGKS